ncbi:MAG: hypothetical protein LUG60_10990 [Erysipelotrichaceae bacterium]|nr:hypothetical protein [Erysipelotrichaceae bacterium]
MSKKFQFDDEFDDDFSDNSQKFVEEDNNIDSEFGDDAFDNVFDFNHEEEDTMAKRKKKKKFRWHWWYYLFIIILVLCLAFGIYIIIKSNNNGPVYGDRCEGLVSISKDLITSTENTIEEKYDSITELDLSIECRTLHVDITFSEGMDTEEAQEIAEETVQTLDDLVGESKEEGNTYSNLFGTIDNETQYEVNVYMTSENSDDFPIYGTKSVQSDEFTYTLASVADEDSAQKALDTLEDDESEEE